MNRIRKYEYYSLRTVFLSNLVTIGIYIAGLYILFKAVWFCSLLFLFYILIFEYRLIRYHCTNCYYWGKLCGFGRSRLSSFFFKKGDISTFACRDITWKDLIPDMLISAIPLIFGIILLITKFDIGILLAIIVLILLTTAGNNYIRGTLTCRHCKQKDLGCSADQLFNKNK